MSCHIFISRLELRPTQGQVDQGEVRVRATSRSARTTRRHRGARGGADDCELIGYIDHFESGGQG